MGAKLPHEPGPWQWYWRKGENGEADCGVFHERAPGQAWAVCRAPRYQTREQWEADGLLISAAPDLADALEAMVWTFEKLGNGKAITQARAALAKAGRGSK